jgi:hypothetical protein
MRPEIVFILNVTAVIFAVITTAGCGGGDELPRVAVSGSVTVDGEPVPNGVVRFAPSPGTEGPMANCMITDGRYRIPTDEGPVAGNYEVRVHAYNDPNAQPTKPTERVAVPADKLGPKTSPADLIDDENEVASVKPAKEAERTFNITIPALPAFQQDFAL